MQHFSPTTGSIPTSEPETALDGPLAGVRVVELATVIMGPYAGQQLGDLGADVIKVESPAGDSTRDFAPQRHRGMAGPTLNLNRNKRSVTLDLKEAVDRAVFTELLDSADIFITNVRPGALDRLGLSPDAVTRAHPRLVYVHAHGFRSDSPQRDNAAYDDIIQAASGMVALNERVSGRAFYTPTVIADKVCGLMIVQSALAALHHRDRTGQGQHVEIPMADTMIAFTLVEHLAGASLVSTDVVDGRPVNVGEYGYGRVLSRERQACRTADGWMCLLPYSDRNWRDFFMVAGDHAAASDSRFTTMAARSRHADELYARMHGLTQQFSNDEWQRICDARSIPAHPIVDIRECAESDYARDGGLVSIAHHPTEGTYRAVAHPAIYSRTPSSIRRHCPTQDQDGPALRSEFADTPTTTDTNDR